MPIFSIITTTYKHEKYITETIESVLLQSSDGWELLIGDDSPDDATWNIIQSYTQRYPNKIRAWHHSPNKGIVENMNFLLSQVSPDSEYIAFLEGDDIYTPDCLEKKLEIFEQYSDVALVYSDMDFINGNSRITHRQLLGSQNIKFYQNEIIPTEEYVGSKNPLIVSYSSVAIRKSVLFQFLPIQNLTDSKTYAVSDYDLFFRISSEQHVYGIRESLTWYRRHSSNLSSNYGGLFDDLILLIERYKKHELISENCYIRKISWIFVLKSISGIAIGEKRNAWEFLKKAQQKMPFSYFLHTTAIVGLLCMPAFIGRKIITQIIRKGS